MKRKIKFLAYPVAIIAMSLFAVGCSDDEDEVLPDEDTPGKVTDIDGNDYKTVKIGNQIWMAENLRVTNYNNGDAIPTGLSDEDWEDTTEGAYAIFDHNHNTADGINSTEEMVEAYGKLYNWYAVNDPRGLCPEGWKIPSDEDWTDLTDYVESINEVNIGNQLKSCRQINSPIEGECNVEWDEHPQWYQHDDHFGTNGFGFSAFPGGYRWIDGGFASGNGSWWSSTETSSTGAWHRGMSYSYGGVFRNNYDKAIGCSLRCVRDAD